MQNSQAKDQPNNNKRLPKVVVIGAGMTGILLVIKLREAGITNITIFEKADRLGGTWRENTYPGAACDVPSYLYSYSFELNPNWSHIYAHGDEIQNYFERIGKKYQVTETIHFNEEVTDAIYRDKLWHIKTSKNRHYQADFVISATGILHHPKLPSISGIDCFKGKSFHTARWDHQFKIDASTRIGVIGNGSTAAQAIPELINGGASVKVFQRTPQWILPNFDFKISEKRKQKLQDDPALLMRYRRWGKFLLEQFFTKAVTGQWLQKKVLEMGCQLNLLLSVKSSILRKKLTPNYQVGCKRIIFNQTYYKAIQTSNAELVTDSIEKINSQGIITRNPENKFQQHDVDLIVYATGFDAFKFMRPINLIGKNGISIEQAWSQEIKLYRSMFMPEFPNFFLMLGPNTPIGNYSVIAMSEVQTDYLIQLIKKWQFGEFNQIEPKPSAVKAFNEMVKQGLKSTAWVGGCQSWYLDAQGDPILWPYDWQRWVDEMKTPDMEDFNCE
ncbi:MAG: NAD(P)/FAD-dependent oxidoreductase [Enterobacterales bacterium]|nr:NAD(P)/FAD-dependent oxidoreductase [Enterobacterales bacterium]